MPEFTSHFLFKNIDNPSKFYFGLFLFLLAVFSISSKAEERILADQNETAWRLFNIETVEHYVIPGYEQFLKAAEQLNHAAQQFCAGVSSNDSYMLQQRFNDTKKAFHNTMDAWQWIQNINFGPVEIGMRHHSIQYWPDKKNHVGKHLIKVLNAKEESAVNANSFKKNSVSVKGLPAIERLLFQKAAVESFKQNPYSCQMMESISQYLHTTARSLHNEWISTMLPQFKDAKQLDGYFEDDIDAATSLLKTLVEPIEVIRDLKLDRPLGSQHSKVKFKRLESWRSMRSLTNLVLNIQSLERFFLGSTPKASGLQPLIRDKEAKQIEENFKDLKIKLSKFEQPIEEAVLTMDGYQMAKNISMALTNLHKNLESAITQSGIRLGFNSRDGD